MRSIVWRTAIVCVSSDQSRKNCPKLRSCHFAARIEYGVRSSIRLESHESELAGEFDVEFQFCAFIAYVSEIAFSIGIRSASCYSDSEVAYHLSHVRSDERTSHIRLLDSRHGRDAKGICPKICIVQFIRICGSFNGSSGASGSYRAGET